jgi:hypothetical protein
MHGGGGEVAKIKVIYVEVAIILDSLDAMISRATTLTTDDPKMSDNKSHMKHEIIDEQFKEKYSRNTLPALE